MTIETTESRKKYFGDNIVVAFAFPFLFPTDEDLDVYIFDEIAETNTLKTLIAHYTVAGENTATSGVVTMLVAPTTDEQLIILRGIDFTQGSDYEDYNRLPSVTIESNFDRLTMICQQIQEEVDRLVGFDVDVTSGVGKLPTPLGDAVVGYNAAGTAWENKILANAATAIFPASGIVVSDGSTTFLGRSIAVTGANASVSNANGVAGNPTIVLTVMDTLIAANVKTADLASTANAKGASRVGVEDSAGYFTAEEVEAVLKELADRTTFEMETGREATLSTTFGTPDTITFDTAFSEPPIVICITESVTDLDVVVTMNTTTTGFKVYGTADVPFNWIAVPAGIYDLGNGIIIQSGTVWTDATVGGAIHAYQTGKTPAICGSLQQCDNADNNLPRFSISNRVFGNASSGADLNWAGRSSQVSVHTDGNIAGNIMGYILISQTDAVKVGNAATATGAQGTIGTLSYETGTVLETTSLTPALTFETAFSAAPAVLVSGESRSDELGIGAYSAHLNAVPTTTGFTVRLPSVDARTGYNWMAFDKGHTTVATAKRIG